MWIQPLTQELPQAVGVAKKKKEREREKEREKRERKFLLTRKKNLLTLYGDEC